MAPVLKTRRPLDYVIEDCSSSSANYVPNNIRYDCPWDQSSRWSSDSTSPPQFVLLRLTRPAVLGSITFGKYEKTHVCNLKRFKVLAGVEKQHLVEILDGGLKNDSSKETFRLRHVVRHHFFPCVFVKIVPLQSFGPSFNFSIWHVALAGDDSDEIVQPALARHHEYKESEAVRLCLKHFRQRNWMGLFEQLRQETETSLEDESLTRIHDHLVAKGDYEAAEANVVQSAMDGVLDGWIASQPPKLSWQPLLMPQETPLETATGTTPTPTAASSAAAIVDELISDVVVVEDIDPSQEEDEEMQVFPQARGGHQMLIDSQQQILYLFGGWDGRRNLSDFWRYSIEFNTWELISRRTECQGGPSPRSCHKMVIDTKAGHIFTLGRFIDSAEWAGASDADNSEQNIKSDFYVYDVSLEQWTQITDNTLAMGGPSLLHEHQMCIDEVNKVIYVFGGHSPSQSLEGGDGSLDRVYSGLFEYHIPTNTWKKRSESGSPIGELKPRSCHSMLFHPGLRKLFILGGLHRRDESSNDFFSYDVDTGEVEIIFSSGNCTGPVSFPEVGAMHRATIDTDKNEIYVMGGLNKERCESGLSMFKNSFWSFDIGRGRWQCFSSPPNKSVLIDKTESENNRTPLPRYAQQLVYDPKHQIHYMFGGTPYGRSVPRSSAGLRLGDLWCLRLQRPSRDEVVRRCQRVIRETNFVEMAQRGQTQRAISFLQTKVAAVVDHASTEEERQFRALASHLFLPSSSSSESSSLEESVHALRSRLFDTLALFFPEHMTHPRGNLVDLIQYPLDSDIY